MTRGPSTNEYQIEVTWNALITNAETGGSPITNYNLEWDMGSNGSSWYDLTGVSSLFNSTDYITTNGVVPDTIY